MSDDKTKIIDLGKVGITAAKEPWNLYTRYERMTIVYSEASGNSYISLRDNQGVNPDNDSSNIWMKVVEHGYSAYELAVRHGFEGTEAEWLQSAYNDATARQMAQLAIEISNQASLVVAKLLEQIESIGVPEDWMVDTEHIIDGAVTQIKINPGDIATLQDIKIITI